MYPSRRGFFLFDTLGAIILGSVVLVIAGLVFWLYSLDMKYQAETKREIQPYLFVSYLYHLSPQVKSVSSTPSSVTVELNSGCSVTLTYAGGELTYSTTCPPSTLQVPGGSVKVDSFTPAADSNGVFLRVCGKECFYFYFTPI